MIDVLAAKRPEDVFGPLDGNITQQLNESRKIYRRLARDLHPDALGGSDAAFKRLGELWEQAKRLISEGSYGDLTALPSAITFTSRKGVYVAERYAPSSDPVAQSFLCRSGHTLKVTRVPRDNDLMQAEARALKFMAEADDDYTKFNNYFPTMADSFTFKEANVIRRINVLEPIEEGFVTLADLRLGYPRGLPAEHMAWIFRRLLTALGVVHKRNLVHGAIVPDSVLIHPIKRGLVLKDWYYSVPIGDTIKAVVDRRRSFYPEEVYDRNPAGPSSDIFMAARCMEALLAGSNYPRPLQSFLKGCTLTLARNPQEAWTLKDEFDELIDRLWKRKYEPLKIPTKEAAYGWR